MMKALLEIFLPGIWSALWIAGGWLLAASLFRLRRGESALIGVGLGLVLQVWLANLLARLLPVVPSFWVSAALVLAAGIAAAVRFRAELRLEVSLPQWFLLAGLTLLFNAIGRGLGIFDDYQNLPTVSLMAAGDIPPHFALNPTLNFGYHYLLLLFSAELMRLASMYPWSALDLGRAFILALPLVLAGLWGYRLTGSRPAAYLTAFMLAFAGGTRWILLLLPQAWLNSISSHVTLIGSAATSAPSLAQAMLSSWKIDGAGPIPFPFAFYTGINQPYVMAYTGIAGSGVLIMLLVLLSAGRWRHWTAGMVTSILIAALAIANEIAFLLVGLGFVVSIAGFLVSQRKKRAGRDLLRWILLLGASLMLAALQGGLLSELLRGRLTNGSETASYFDTTVALVWPPAIISAHLGSLSLINAAQLVGALAEIGPVILITPLAFAWGWKSLRLGKWYEASLIAASLGALLALFVAFQGPLFTATPRLMSGWFFVCVLYAVPLLWVWTRRRGDGWKITCMVAGLMTCLGGIVLFAVQMTAIQKPIYATFITPMDAKMSQEHWNTLPRSAWIFDPVVFRAPTVFGRFTDSSPSWYTRTDAWQALNNAPDPFRMRSAGFSYIYFDRDYWDSFTRAQQLIFNAPCVKQVAEVDGIHSPEDYTKDFRRLLDIQACQ
jgi:general stress protein CsbA